MRRSERGSGSVLVLVGLALLAPVVVGGLAGARVFLTHREVAGAADLAALAGATAQLHGRPPCQAASQVAAANGARLVGCELRNGAVRVEVEAEIDLPLGLSGRIREAANAGEEPSSPGDPAPPGGRTSRPAPAGR